MPARRSARRASFCRTTWCNAMTCQLFLWAAHCRSTAAFGPFAGSPMLGWDGACLAVSIAAFAATVGCFGASAQEQPRPGTVECGGETIARGTASRVIDGRTLALGDGSEVLLAAIEVPPLPQESDTAPGGAAARDGLAALLTGAEIVFKQAEQHKTDRYGRILAYAVAARDGVERSVQAELVAAGLARVAPRAGSRACALELLSRERAARRAGLGLWANSYYDSLNAEDPAEVLAKQGHFALVEGKVLSVRESGATIYVNFGRRWTTDFTVTILKRNGRSFTAAGVEPKKLEGRRIRVRGWIEQRGGPWIEAARPEQIELTDRQ
jgi:endonuclease YncB( thermonuclease family)